MFTSVRVVSFQRLSWASWTPWQSIKIHSPQFVSFRRTSTQERTLEMIDERVVFYISLCASLFLLGKEKARPRFFFVALSTNIDISKRWTHRTTLSDRIRWRKDGGGGLQGRQGARASAQYHRLEGDPPPSPFARMHLYSFPPSRSLPSPPRPDRPTKFPLALGNTNALLSLLLLLLCRIPSALENNTPPSLLRSFHSVSRVSFFLVVLLFRTPFPSSPSSNYFIGYEVRGARGWIWLKFGWNRIEVFEIESNNRVAKILLIFFFFFFCIVARI